MKTKTCAELKIQAFVQNYTVSPSITVSCVYIKGLISYELIQLLVPVRNLRK